MQIEQAIGRYLLAEVSEGRYSAEEFLICRQQSDGPQFVLLTSEHALCVSWPGLRFFPMIKWAVQIQNILHVRRDKERVFLLALQPSAEQVTKKSPLSHQGVRMASPTPTLLFSASVPLQDEAGARSIANCLMDANAFALWLGRSRTVTQLTLGSAGGGMEVVGVMCGGLSPLQLQEVRVAQILRACGLEESSS